MASKSITRVVKIQLPAGKATPAPPVGTVLGPTGINLMSFTKAFNEQTAAQIGSIIPVEITIFEDRSFTFIMKTPPAVEMIKKIAGIEKGSSVPNKDKVATITKEQVLEIAKNKLPDLNTKNLEAAMRIIEGSARSMGVVVTQ